MKGVRLCILVDDAHVDEVRRIGKKVMLHFCLKIPVSATGENPATHWFCTMTVNQELHDKLMKLANWSEMEVGRPKAFLEKRGLRVIR